jgi:hypothetical protein
MTENDQKGEVRHVNIYRCKPQADDSSWDLFDKIPAEDLGDYKQTKDIVRGFMGKLERKPYNTPSRKNARAHDFSSPEIQQALNRLSTFSLQEEENEENENSASTKSDGGAVTAETEGEEEEESSVEFNDVAKTIIENYNAAPKSVDCFLLLVEYKWESDRHGSDDRLMIVQLPFKENVFTPEDGGATELFSELQEAFENQLKKSVLYPYQEVSETILSEEDTETEKEPKTENREKELEAEEGNSEQEANLGNAFLYQRNGQANYWHTFLDLYDEDHEDEILANQRIRMVKQFHDDEKDDPDDPFTEIESLEDIDQDDLPDEIEEYRDSGVVVEIGNIKIQGLTVGQILDQDSIGFYEDDDTGEIYTIIKGDEPSISPVGKGTIKLPNGEDEDNQEENDTSENEESVDIPVFPNLSEYPNVNELFDD